MYSLKQAADAVGKSKATIHRDVKKGKISADKDDNGHYKIDPSELHRVYPAVTSETSLKRNNETKQDGTNILENNVVQALLKAKDKEIELQESLIEQVKSERDKIYGLITNQSKQATKEIEDLRAKLDHIEQEKRLAETEKEKALRTAKHWKTEANKPWYKKIFG